ncbi:hypothetical protein L5515_009251 [Caenorhabditis briggsae]|uniref:Uncharacterized protein n=1 Tax=Caenorhabditis briggsae TaxID=6238 RepID=A0AAE9F9T9_CAEBR|nr:hypothetical protein L5515_009251 [Caenorhabditis briggsae]
MSSTHVNIQEFYTRSWKYLVYRHAECGYFWVQKGCSIHDPTMCPRCRKPVPSGIMIFPTLREAEQYHMHMLCQKQDEVNQINVAKMLNERITMIEATKPRKRVMMNGVEVTTPFNGQFYERWLNWDNVQWPTPETHGVNQWKNTVSNMNFGPKVNEEKVYTWEAPTISMEKNVSVWKEK